MKKILDFFKMVKGCVILILIPSDLAISDTLLEAKIIYQKYDDNLLAKDATQHPLGLQAETLLNLGNQELAQDILKKAPRKTALVNDAITLRLLKIAVKKGQSQDYTILLDSLKNSSLMKNTGLMQQLYKELPKKEKSHLVASMIKANFFNNDPVSSCPYFELNERKIRADFLYQLAMEQRLPSHVREKLLYELYIVLPETKDDDELNKISGFKGFSAKVEISDLIKRMELLLTFGKNAEARATNLLAQKSKKKISREELCELDYVDAKVDRKLKLISKARERFSKLNRECPKIISKKASFMNLMLASMQRDEKSLDDFDSFLREYPSDSFSDDVLIFKTNLLLALNRVEDAQRVLELLIERYPDGDMIKRALFLYGFNFAKLKLIDRAISSFTRLKEISDEQSPDFAGAHYWIARLLVFDDLTGLTPPKRTRLEEAKKMLRSLVTSSSKTVYSWLAFILLEHLGENPRSAFTLAKPRALENVSLPIRHLKDVLELAIEGFRSEALFMLNETALKETDVDKAAEMALLYDALNTYGIAHHKLVRCNTDLALKLSHKLPQPFKKIAYPHFYEEEILAAQERVDVQKPLVLGIMRQESGFIKDSCSWAGAKGLMQLMFSSAKDQGQRWSISKLNEKHLYLPAINVFLGSSLLQKYWQQFGNLAVGLCAYNAGPAIARREVNKNKAALVDQFIEDLALAEPRTYVKSVLGNTYAYAIDQGLDSLPRLDLMVTLEKPSQKR